MLSCRKSKLYHSSIDSIAFVGNRAIYSINKNIISIYFQCSVIRTAVPYTKVIRPILIGFDNKIRTTALSQTGNTTAVRRLVNVTMWRII